MSHRRGPRLRLQFIGRFLVLWLGGMAIIAFFPAIETAAIGSTAQSFAFALRPLGIDSSVSGSVVTAAGTSIAIIPDCTTMLPTVSLTAAIVATALPLSWTVLGTVAGALSLWIYNLLRLGTLLLVLHSKPSLFQPVHVYLWQPMTLLAVIALYVGWLRVVERAQGKS